MDFSTTIPLRTGSETSDTWRLAISLAIALGVHAVLITMPVSLAPPAPGTAASNKSPLRIILSRGNRGAETSPVPDTEQTSTPAKPRKREPRSAEKSDKVGEVRPAAPARTDAQARSKSTPKSEAPSAVDAGTVDMPDDSATGSRSTVFDPGLRKKLDRERNRVRRFEAGDVHYMTTSGTFVQQGDRCWEVKRLIPGDTSSESSQWLRTRCPENSRSSSDIDRLAERYGIP